MRLLCRASLLFNCKDRSDAISVAALLALFFSLSFAGASTNAQAADSSAPAPKTAQSAQGGNQFRNFYDVLEDLLGDFEYDLKNNQVTGLKDLAIRNVATSENIPPSFKQHLELVVTERIMRNSNTKVIQCLPCRAKRTTLNGDQVVITSPETNPVELSRIAKMSNIMHFMDLAFAYQPTGMVLSMYITDPETGTVIWSRSYNSETSRASAYRRGVDYAQVDDARKQTEYIPTIQYRATAYYLFEKNVSSYTGCIGAGFRMVERYDNRRKEVGFEADYLKNASSFVSSGTTGVTTTTTGTAAAPTTDLYGGFNITLLFIHSWNLIGDEENFNLVRGNVFAAVGGTYASGYIGGLLRTGYEWRLAKHWAISTNLGYRPPSTAFITTNTSASVTGMEFGLGISGLF